MRTQQKPLFFKINCCIISTNHKLCLIKGAIAMNQMSFKNVFCKILLNDKQREKMTSSKDIGSAYELFCKNGYSKSLDEFKVEMNNFLSSADGQKIMNNDFNELSDEMLEMVAGGVNVKQIATTCVAALMATFCISGAITPVGAAGGKTMQPTQQSQDVLTSVDNYNNIIANPKQEKEKLEKEKKKKIDDLDKGIKDDNEWITALNALGNDIDQQSKTTLDELKLKVKEKTKLKENLDKEYTEKILNLNNKIKEQEIPKGEQHQKQNKNEININDNKADKEKQQKEKERLEKELNQRCENKLQELKDVRKKIAKLFKLKKGDNFAKDQVKALGICLNLHKKLQNNFTADAAKRMIEEADKVINEVNERIDKNKAEQDKKKLEEDMEKLEKEEERQAALQRYAVEEIDREDEEDKKKFEESQKALLQCHAMEKIDEDEKFIIKALQDKINKSAGELREAEKEFVKFTNSKNLTFANNEKVKEVTKALYKCYELEKRLKNKCVAYRAKKFFDLKKEALKLIDELKKEYGEPLKEIEKIPAKYNEARKEIEELRAKYNEALKEIEELRAKYNEARRERPIISLFRKDACNKLTKAIDNYCELVEKYGKYDDEARKTSEELLREKWKIVREEETDTVFEAYRIAYNEEQEKKERIDKKAKKLEEAEKELATQRHSKDIVDKKRGERLSRLIASCYKLAGQLKDKYVDEQANEFFDSVEEALSLIDKLKKEYAEKKVEK